jgi:hypothetical protein
MELLRRKKINGRTWVGPRYALARLRVRRESVEMAQAVRKERENSFSFL